MITKHPQHGRSNGISTLKLAAGPQGKLMKCKTRAAVEAMEEQYLLIVPVPVHRMEIFYSLAAEPYRELLKLAIRGYVQAKLASRR